MDEYFVPATAHTNRRRTSGPAAWTNAALPGHTVARTRDLHHEKKKTVEREKRELCTELSGSGKDLLETPDTRGHQRVRIGPLLFLQVI